MNSVVANELITPSSSSHPTASNGKEVEQKLPDYSKWNSVANIKRFIAENTIGRTKSGVLIMKKEASYSATLDFMTLIDLPEFSLDITKKGNQTQKRFFEDITVGEVLNFCGLKNKESELDTTKKIVMCYKELMTFLEENNYGKDLVQLIAHTSSGEKQITPDSQVAELCPINWGDLEKMGCHENKKDIQKLIGSFLKKEPPEEGKSLVVGVNYTQGRLDGYPTGKEGGGDSQSLKDLHFHFFELDRGGKEITVTPEEEIDFHDDYVANALKSHGFNWGDKEFSTLRPTDNTKRGLAYQGITLEVVELGTPKFWEEFDYVTGLVEELNISAIDPFSITKNQGEPSEKSDAIIHKLHHNGDKYTGIIEKNRFLVKDIVQAILEKEDLIDNTTRLDESNILIPYPNFGYTLTLEKNYLGAIELKIIPRFHSRAAVVESLGIKFKREAVEDEDDFKDFVNQSETRRNGVLEEML